MKKEKTKIHSKKFKGIHKFKLGLLKRTQPNTIESAITRTFTRVTLLAFLIVFGWESIHSGAHLVRDIDAKNRVIFEEIKGGLRNSGPRNADTLRSHFLQNMQNHPEIKCGKIRLNGVMEGDCAPYEAFNLGTIRSIGSFTHPLDGAIEIHFNIASLWPKVARRITSIFLPLFITALITLYFTRRVANCLIQQLGIILNSVNGDKKNPSVNAIVYSDLLSFKRNLDDLLEIKEVHNEQIQRLKIAKQLEHDIHSPLFVLRMIIPQVGGISDEEKRAILSSIQRITDISKDIGRIAEKPALNKTSQEMAEPLQLPTSSEKEPETIPPPSPLSPMTRVKEVLEDLILEKRVESSGRNPIHLDFDRGLHSLGLYARPENFSRVVSNLINNAIEASPAKSSILVIVRLAEDQSLILSVMDQGKGIPEEDLKKLGNYGFTRGKSRGSGIGLFSAKEFLSELGAKLEIDSMLDVGTTVSMRFPPHKLASLDG